MPSYLPSPPTIHLPIPMCEVRPPCPLFHSQEFNHLSGSDSAPEVRHPSATWGTQLLTSGLVFWGPHCAAQPLLAVPPMSSLLTGPHLSPLSPGSILPLPITLAQILYLCVACPSPPPLRAPLSPPPVSHLPTAPLSHPPAPNLPLSSWITSYSGLHPNFHTLSAHLPLLLSAPSLHKGPHPSPF